MSDPREPARRPAPRRIVVGGGVGLHVVEWSPANGGHPFLLVHGLASNCRTWEAVAGRLAAAGHPVAAVDLRGHGRSDQPDDGYDFATLSSDLVDVLDALGYDQPVVVGQSTGGNLALELARWYGRRLAGVGGIDGGAIELQGRWPAWDDCAAALAPPRWDGTLAHELEARLRRSFPTWSDWGVEATMANFAVDRDGTVRPHLPRDRHLRILRALWEHRPSTVASEVAVPMLLIVADGGTDDAAAGRGDAERLAARLARGRVHVVPAADHDVHVQQPETVAGLLLAAVADGFFPSPSAG